MGMNQPLKVEKTRWITSGPLCGSVEWDADIVEARENDRHAIAKTLTYSIQELVLL